MEDLRNKFVSLSGVLREVPSAKKLSLYLLAASFLGGFLTRLLQEGDPFRALVWGAAEGFMWLFLPAVLSAALCSAATSRAFFKYFLLAGVLSAGIAGSLYALGVAASYALSLKEPFVFFANALVFLVGFGAAYLVLSSRLEKALALGLLHPFFNLSFLFLWSEAGLVESAYLVEPTFLTAVKFLVSSGILLLALAALFYVINAPAKRNFGVTTLQAIPLFFAQWLQGKQDLEDFLGEFGDNVRTLFGMIVFRRKKDRTLKALFFAPHIHFGPFGSLGGSEFPAKLKESYSSRHNATIFAFHCLVTHDVNPLHARQFEQVEKIYDRMLSRAEGFVSTGSLSQARRRENRVSAMAFGKSALFSITRAPYSTEDFDLSAGFVLRSLALKNFDDALIVDRHNAITNGDMFDVGSPEFERFEETIGSLGPGKTGALSLGTASDGLENATGPQGIGKGGLNVAVLGFGKKRACIILVDGNNALPEFREKVLARVGKYGFDFVDLFTTDTHAVNTIGGIHNPLGAHTPPDLLDRIDAAVAAAVKNVEPVEAAFMTERADVSVLGMKRQTELVSTVNAIVSVAKILAPAALVVSFLLVILALLWVK